MKDVESSRLLSDLGRVLTAITALVASYAPAQAQGSLERVVIEGTALTIVPPAGFVASERFRGFESVEYSGAMIMVMEMPAPFAEATAGFDEGPLAANGMELLGRDPIKVGEVRGLRLDLAQEAEGMRFRKTLVVFGDSSKTTMVNATWLAEDEEALAGRMAASLASIELDEALAADPRGALDFSLDESVGNLRQAAVVGTSLLVNRKGKIEKDAADFTAVLVDRSYSAPIIADPELFVELRMRQLPGNWHLAADAAVEKVTYGGLEGYQLRAVDESSERGEAATIAVVYETEGGYFVLMGMYRLGDVQGQADAEEVMGSFGGERGGK